MSTKTARKFATINSGRQFDTTFSYTICDCVNPHTANRSPARHIYEYMRSVAMESIHVCGLLTFKSKHARRLCNIRPLPSLRGGVN